MNENKDLFVFGTFGIPNGFRQSQFIGDVENFKQVKSFDLNTNSITLFKGTKLHSLRKQKINEDLCIAYSIYSFAREKNSNRGGTFIGASIITHNYFANVDLVNECLNDLNDLLVKNDRHVADDVILVTHSEDLRFSRKPKNFENFVSGNRITDQIDFTSNNRDLVIYALFRAELIEKCTILLNFYDTIFFTSSEPIAAYVSEKSLLKLLKNQAEVDKEVLNVEVYIKNEKERKFKLEIEKIGNGINNIKIKREQFYNSTQTLLVEARQHLRSNQETIDAFAKQNNYNKLKIDDLVKQFNSSELILNKEGSDIEFLFNEFKTGKKSIGEITSALEVYSKKIMNTHASFIFPNISSLEGVNDHRSQTKPVNPTLQHRSLSKTQIMTSEKSSGYGGLALCFFLLWVFTLLYFFFSDDLKYIIDKVLFL